MSESLCMRRINEELGEIVHIASAAMLIDDPMVKNQVLGDIQAAISALLPVASDGRASRPATADWLDMPRNIRLQRFTDGENVTFIGQYRNPNSQGNDRPKRVYKIEIYKKPLGTYSIWAKDGTTIIFHMDFTGRKTIAQYVAVKALKAYLMQLVFNCRKRKNRAAKEKVHA